MQPVIICPTIALDVSLLDRLAASIDYPLDKKIIINGGRKHALDRWAGKHRDWEVLTFYDKDVLNFKDALPSHLLKDSVSNINLGFGGSCNVAPKLFPEASAFILCNDDEELQPGCLERICQASEQHAKDVHMIYVNRYDAFDLCVWTAKAAKDFGLFDENLWPAYFEDYDMRARFSLGDFKAHYITDTDFPVKHGKPHPCGPNYHAMMDALKPINEDYMLRKWGTLGDKPVFKTPFNDPHQRISEWRLEVENRRRREEICARFWNQSNPSLYE